MKRYILITAARNEQENIEDTIKAVRNQTLLPEKWVICLNGSTDGTEAIINRYVNELPFIHLINLHDIAKPSFSRKAAAIMEGYSKIKNSVFDFIGILDADVTFQSDYYEKLIEKFHKDPNLGLVTGDFYEIQKNGCYKLVEQPRDFAISGSAQLFRKKSFDDIGGYKELSSGGIDTLAAVMVRMYGWRTYIYEDVHFYHNRTLGGKYTSSKLIISFKEGLRDNRLGMHLLYAITKSISRLKKKPYIVGSLFWSIGFLYCFIKEKEMNISPECKKYLQKEQLDRLKSIFLCSRNRKNILLIMNKAFCEDPRQQRMINALLENKYRVDVVCFSDEKRKTYSIPNLTFYQFPLVRIRRNRFTYIFEYLSYFLYCFLLLPILIVKKRYAAIQIVAMPEFLVFTTIIPKIMGIKILVDWMDPMLEIYYSKYRNLKIDLFPSIIKICEKCLTKLADSIMVPNIGFCRAFNQRGLNTDKFMVIMNSADEEVFNTEPDFNSQGDSLKLLWNGTITHRNGPDVMAKAFNISINRISDLKLTILGYGSDEKQFLESREYNETSSFISFIGKANLHTVVDHIKESDIGVISNHRTPFTEINLPTRIFEFGIMGKPVICADLPGIRDYFDDSTIIFFKPGDPESLADCIEKVYYKRQLLENYAKALYNQCRKFSWQKSKEAYLETIQCVLTGNKQATINQITEMELTGLR